MKLPIKIMYDVEQLVCDGEGMTPAQLRTDRRYADVVLTKQIIIYLLLDLFGRFITQKQVGEFYHRDRTTVIYIVKTLTGYTQVDKAFCCRIENYRHQIKKLVAFSDYAEKEPVLKGYDTCMEEIHLLSIQDVSARA